MIKTRVTEMLGVEYPIVQAPMGWIARTQFASAVSNASGLGIIETSSGEFGEVREEVTKMRTLADKPFGVNIAQAFVRDPDIVSFVVDQGVKFVTTSAGEGRAQRSRPHRVFMSCLRWQVRSRRSKQAWMAWCCEDRWARQGLNL